MKAHNIILNNEHYPLLEARTNVGNSGLKLSTGYGYIEFGPLNGAHAHIQTDLTNFYFNKEIMVNSGVIGSYDEDLYLRRATNSSHQIQISTTAVSTPLSLDVEGNIEFTSHSHKLRSERAQNAEVRTGTAGAGGVLFRNNSGGFLAQLYGDGTNYGFLDGVWAGWDLKKTTNGKLTFNGNDTYFLQPEHANSAKFRQYVQIGDSSTYGTNDGSWGARLNVTDNVHSKIIVGQDADSMVSHWYAHTGHTSIKFGTGSSHDVEFQRAGSTLLELEPGGLMTMVPIRRNSHHASGFLEGSYNNPNLGANSTKTNPIYTIGSSYNPAETTFSNMYGIGYSHPNFWGTSNGKNVGWGQYAVEGGVIHFIAGLNGTWSKNEFNRNGNKVWDAGNDGPDSGLDADTVDGMHASEFMKDEFLDSGYVDFTVNGDADTYYPVSIQGGGQMAFQMYSISRKYNWTAPNTWYTSSHRGGLTLTWQYSGDGFWGGNDHDIRVIKWDETYSTICMGMGGSVGGGGTNAGVVVWLRGGGAVYRFHGPRASAGDVNIHLTSVTASNSTVFAPRSYNSGTRNAEILPKYPVRNHSELYDNNNRVWHVGNDGPGSGLQADNADTVDGLHVHTGRNNEASKIVRTDSDGYIQADWINTTSGARTTQAITRVYASNDAYIRYYTLADFGPQISPHVTRLQSYNNFLNLSSGTGNNANLNTTFQNGKSGHFDVWGGDAGSNNKPPGTTHVQGIQVRHNTAAYHYGWQLASQYSQPGKIYHRGVTDNTFSSWATIWSSINDGPSSGLDADTVDGIQAASTLHKPNNTGYYRPNTWIDFRDAGAAGLYWGSGTAAGWHIYPLNTGQFSLRSGNTSYIQVELMAGNGTRRGALYANDSSDVGILDDSGHWAIRHINHSGTQFRQNNQVIASIGAGQVSGDYGSMVVRESKNGWYGYSINNQWAFMANGSSTSGIFNDTDNEWAIQCTRNAETKLYYDGGVKLATTTGGVSVTGEVETGNFKALGGGHSYYYTSSGNLRGYVAAFETAPHLRIATSGNESIGFYDGGTGGTLNVEISGAGALTVRGNVTAYGSFSDIRLKENIEIIPNAVEKVQKLDGITFNYKKDGERSTGLIAQQLLEVLPEAVYETEDIDTKETHYALRYGNVVGLLVEALKEQQTQIDNLTNLVNELKER